MAVEHIKVDMTDEQMQDCTEDLVKAMNDSQQVKGYSIDQVLFAYLFVLGAALRQRGGVLLVNLPLKEALPPLALGYEAQCKAEGDGRG
jgi:hypothetical protein